MLSVNSSERPSSCHSMTELSQMSSAQGIFATYPWQTRGSPVKTQEKKRRRHEMRCTTWEMYLFPFARLHFLCEKMLQDAQIGQRACSVQRKHREKIDYSNSVRVKFFSAAVAGRPGQVGPSHYNHCKIFMLGKSARGERGREGVIRNVGKGPKCGPTDTGMTILPR